MQPEPHWTKKPEKAMHWGWWVLILLMAAGAV